MNDTLNRWIQRVTLAAMVALAAALLAVGVALYAPATEAHETPALCACVSRASESGAYSATPTASSAAARATIAARVTR